MKYMDTLMKCYGYLWILIAFAIICRWVADGEDPLQVVLVTVVLCSLICYWSAWLFFTSYCLVGGIFLAFFPKKKKKKKGVAS